MKTTFNFVVESPSGNLFDLAQVCPKSAILDGGKLIHRREFQGTLEEAGDKAKQYAEYLKLKTKLEWIVAK